MNKVYHYPLMYHSNKSSSDIEWIMRRLAIFDEEKQKEVSVEYERIYMEKVDGKYNRKGANEYLQRVAIEQRDYLKSTGQLL